MVFPWSALAVVSPSLALGLALLCGAILLRRLRRGDPPSRLRLLAFGCSLATTVLVVELGAWLYDLTFQPNKWQRWENTEETWIHHDRLGKAPAPSSQARVTKYVGDEIIYRDALTETDALGRRVCDPQLSAQALEHAIFMGGSFVFGEGLHRRDTLPCQLGAQSQGRFRPYSYSLAGWGTSQVLVMLQDEVWWRDVQPREGFALYLFIAPHVVRTVGDGRRTSMKPTWPIFRLDDQGELEGPMRERDIPLLHAFNLIYRYLRPFSPAMKVLLYDRRGYVFYPRDKAVRATALTIVAARDRYEARFDGRFLVMMHPRTPLEEHEAALFFEILDQHGVTVLRPPPLPDPEAAVLHPLDDHPSAAENAHLAGWLLDRLDADATRSP
jgi:hypothetical protein